MALSSIARPTGRPAPCRMQWRYCRHIASFRSRSRPCRLQQGATAVTAVTAAPARTGCLSRESSAGMGSAAPPCAPRSLTTFFGPTLAFSPWIFTTPNPHHITRSALSQPPRLRAFSCSASTAMPATKIDGTAIAKNVRERLRAEIAEKKAANPRFQPCLKIIQGVYYSVCARHVLPWVHASFTLPALHLYIGS
jgi:hypothetical protein